MNNGINISGVFPHLAVRAGHLPQRTETGIGALMPWADRLWFVTYVAHKSSSGSGTGLFYVDDDLQLHQHPASVVGTYANRMIHAPTNQLLIGPHAIDVAGNVRTFEDLVDIRLTATAKHLTDPDNLVYMLGMEGELYEANVQTLACRQIADLMVDLNPMGPGQPGYSVLHLKGAYTAHGRLVVANNTYDNRDYTGASLQGRLAEWDGSTWTILDNAQHNEVTGAVSGIGNAIFATGQDRASAILRVFVDGQWSVYRLPKATHTQDHTFTTEWPRIREIESERWLMNTCGMLYELPAMQYAGRVWGVRPVCSHLRIIGDFCSWKGLVVMAGDQTTPIGDSNPFVGQPQANLWLGKSDDLWQWGKPKGWGGPWFRTAIAADVPSDPFLMTGFEHKCVHFSHDRPGNVNFTIEVDFHGDGEWHAFDRVSAVSGYASYCFPTGFSAHWVRFRASAACTASAQLHYT